MKSGIKIKAEEHDRVSFNFVKLLYSDFPGILAQLFCALRHGTFQNTNLKQ